MANTRMRLLATALMLLIAALAPARAASPLQDYLAARTAYEKKFKDSDIVGDQVARAVHERALADLETRLRKIVGPVRIEGFPEGKINLDSLADGFEGFGLLDGLVYKSSDAKTQIVVTTDALLGQWLTAHKTWWNAKHDIPPGLEAALKSESFYTQALNTDAAFFKFVDIPLTKPADAAFAYAVLVGRAQDFGLQVPDEIIVALRRGGRLFVVSAPAAATVAAVPTCARSYQEAEKQALAADGDKSDRLREDAYRAFRRCFAAQATHESYFPTLVKQVQGLVDVLPAK